MSEFVSVVIPAAGQGKRLKKSVPKAAVQLRGTPIIDRTVQKFISFDRPVEIVVVEPPGTSLDELIKIERNGANRVRFVKGGSSRFASVQNGVRSLQQPSETLLIHDAARPFVTEECIQRVVRTVDQSGAAIPVIPIPDTVKRVRNDQVIETVDRSELFRAQTPQGFRRRWYEEAIENVTLNEGQEFTDDASVVQNAGYSVRTVEGAERNFKITYPEDLNRAEHIIRDKEEGL